MKRKTIRGNTIGYNQKKYLPTINSIKPESEDGEKKHSWA